MQRAEDRYVLLADDVEMQTFDRWPNQYQIDRVAALADARGWNGTTLDLHKNGEWIAVVSPSGEN